MKQRFYIMIESNETIEPKDILFALREARPNWGGMSASLATQQNAHLTGLHCPACTSLNEEIVTCARCGTVKSAPQVA